MSIVPTITTKKALRRAAQLGLEVRPVNRTGETDIIDPTTRKRVRMNVRRHDASLALRLMMRNAEQQQHKEHTMPKGAMISQSQIDEIAERRRAGEEIKAIADVMGIGASTVSRMTPKELRSRQGMVFPDKQTSPTIQAQIAKLRREGKTIDQVAEATGVSTATVFKYTPDELKKKRARPTNAPPPPEDKSSSLPTPDRQTTTVGDRLVAYVEPTPEARAANPLSAADLVYAMESDYKDYPEVTALVARQRRYKDLLALAEKTGDEDIQLMVMSKLELTGLEKEAVALWETVHADRANGH